jgi:hypothetical protein
VKGRLDCEIIAQIIFSAGTQIAKSVNFSSKEPELHGIGYSILSQLFTGFKAIASLLLSTQLAEHIVIGC